MVTCNRHNNQEWVAHNNMNQINFFIINNGEEFEHPILFRGLISPLSNKHTPKTKFYIQEKIYIFNNMKDAYQYHKP